jgi:hypothetical protein
MNELMAMVGGKLWSTKGLRAAILPPEGGISSNKLYEQGGNGVNQGNGKNAFRSCISAGIYIGGKKTYIQQQANNGNAGKQPFFGFQVGKERFPGIGINFPIIVDHYTQGRQQGAQNKAQLKAIFL